MYSYQFTKSYNLEKLNLEIEAAHIPMISMDLISSSVFVVNCAAQLTNDQLAALNRVVAAHIASTSMVDFVASRIIAARAFGIKLIAQYGAQNVLAGYSIEIIQDVMIRTAKVQAALNSGSLYVAITEINSIVPDDTVITAVKLQTVRNQIEDYLGIPRT